MESTELKITIANASRNAWTVTARVPDHPLYIDLVRILNASARGKFVQAAAEALRLSQQMIALHLDKIASDLAAEQEQLEADRAVTAESTQPDTHKTSTPVLPAFLDKLKPLYRTPKGEIYLGEPGRAFSVSKLYTLPGAIELVRTLPEWNKEHDRHNELKPTAEIRLAKELFALAGGQMLLKLQEESAEDHARYFRIHPRGIGRISERATRLNMT